MLDLYITSCEERGEEISMDLALFFFFFFFLFFTHQESDWQKQSKT